MGGGQGEEDQILVLYLLFERPGRLSNGNIELTFR